MALTGLEIFKLLPNTNCRECGYATCLAFAMRVAAKKVEAEACPYLSEEAKEILKRIIREWPYTSHASKAKELLDNLK